MTADKRALAIGVFVWALVTTGVEGTVPEPQAPEAGRIEGSIVDDTLEPVAGVPVTLERTGRTLAKTTTDTEGSFHFNRITLGTYDVSAAREGYSAVRKPVTLKRAGSTVLLGLTMARDAIKAAPAPPSSPATIVSTPQSRSIYGVVTDTSGGALPGATVTVTGPAGATPLATAANQSGAYEVGALPVGAYRVSFQLVGFKTVTNANVIVYRDKGTRLDQKLEVGALTEELTVSAATPLVNTRGTAASAQWNIAGGSVSGLSSTATSSPVTSGGRPPNYSNFDSFEQIETARYARITPNRFNLTAVEPLSTFGADVDTASYTNVRRFLNEGRLPPADAVRVEEFVNYFKFDYDAPARDRAVGITSEVGACPWAPGHKLVLVGARAQAGADTDAPRNLVFLIDVSGSMQPAERLPLLKTALGMFVDTLRPADEVSIVTYAGNSGVALWPTPARQRDRIQDAIASLGAGGSTNGGAGLMLAYRLARQQFVAGGINRIILATDGDFNVGVTGQRDLYQLIDREKRSGVFLSVLGVGTNNLQDRTMEMLADKGNGHYAYLDSLQEARRVLIRESGSTLETVARDVKFQVEFNPAAVQAWRLIGYENRLMAHEAFNDDRKDGGELGAGHTITVLYEVVPVGVALPKEAGPAERPGVEPLIYQGERRVTAAANRDELLTVHVRYKQPDESESVKFDAVVRAGGRDRHLTFASAVAEFGLMLRTEEAAPRRWEALLARSQSLPLGRDSSGERAGFVRMVELAAGLARLR